MSLRFRRGTRGVSTVIVVVLSLVILTVVVANVVLWTFEMNQLDWERTKEDLEISDVAQATNSSWWHTQNEYTVNLGVLANGTYLNTQVADNVSETFTEGAGSEGQRFDINGTFNVDLSTYPSSSIKSIEIQLRYKADDTMEAFHLEAYDWVASTYSDNGFNNTSGHTPTGDWNFYTVNLTDKWLNYLNDDGSMDIKLLDNQADTNQTTIDIDFLAIRVLIDGATLTFRYRGSITCHIVSIWVNNVSHHERYEVNLYINAGETVTYTRSEIALPEQPYVVKATTERGNISVYPVD